MCLKPKVKKMNWFVSLITFGWASGITLAPFGIYIQEKYLNWLWIQNHEKNSLATANGNVDNFFLFMVCN